MLNTSSVAYQGRQERLQSSRVESLATAVIGQVYSTTNYAMFRFSESNRPINGRHLEILCEAVLAKNLLHRHPILVTREGLVIDGQHRLKVAQALHLPIYYMVVDDMSVADIANTNAVNLKWTARDYLHYWSVSGNENYRQIEQFAKRYNTVPLSYIAQFCGQNSSVINASAAFRQGKADAGKLKELERILTTALDFKPYLGKRWASRTLLAAVDAMLATPGYNHTTMMTRLEYLSTRLRPCVSAQEYLTLLSEIYNFKARSGKLQFARASTQRVKRANATRKKQLA